MEDFSLDMLQRSHSSEIFNLIDMNRPHLRRWLPWVDGVEGAEDTSQFIDSTILQNEKGRGSQYAVMYCGAVAGVIGFHPIDWPNRNAEIGYWLGEQFTGLGLVTRSAAELLGMGFNDLNLNRMEIRCASENTGSLAVAKRLGMVYEGTLREEEWLYDHFVDHAVYSMLQREFKRGPYEN